jgi:hypothetical protein
MPPEDDFSDVFGAGAEGAPVDELEDETMEDDAESDDALDAAIDEAFSAEDPVVRREAFKNAVRLCKEY